MFQSDKEIKEFLDFKYKLFNNQSYIETDPIQIPHKYNSINDIEISAFIASQLAWGNRKAIIKSATKLLNKMGDSPCEWLLDAKDEDYDVFDDFVYRTFNSSDIKYFIFQLSDIVQNHSSLGNYFKLLYEKSNSDVKSMLQLFRDSFMNNASEKTARHMGSISKGSAAKRLNMFLRWMVRNDNLGVDFGIWNFISPKELFIPLDVHSGRVARKLGLLKRNANDWKSVDLLTSKLKTFDPDDPVKYDFALFGLGVFERF